MTTTVKTVQWKSWRQILRMKARRSRSVFVQYTHSPSRFQNLDRFGEVWIGTDDAGVRIVRREPRSLFSNEGCVIEICS